MPSAPEPIAIVGLGAAFPGAGDVRRYWENLVGGVDAIREAPAARLDPVFFDAPGAPPSGRPDRLYCRRGGFLEEEATFNPLAFGVMPRAAEGAEPDQLLMLQVAQAALRDAGLAESDARWRQRTAVIFGRGGYLTPGLVRLDQRIRTAQQLVDLLAVQLPGIAPETLAKLQLAFQSQLGPFGPDTAIGLVPNLAASRVANRLDLGGPAYTVDAACASSLVAVDQACRELRSGRSDVALAGGVHVCQDVTFWSVFNQLGALSRTGQIRPFDRRADGLLIGEGAGVLVLQRLSDARRDGRRIYARLLGVGVASDGRGATLLSPRVDGQLLALTRAWEEAGVDPTSIGFVEAHGTATVQGDDAELTTLARFFGEAAPGAAPALLGSVKSMIGHAMPAAGAAGLIKAALALHHGTIPPSLHCEEPHAGLQKTRFRVPAIAADWPTTHGPRRAGVNAFGFGGINAHVVLEEAEPAHRRPRAMPPRPPGGESPLVLSARHTAELLAGIERGVSQPGPGPLRLVLFRPTPERRALARKVVERQQPWRDHDDLWFSPKGLLGPTGGGGRVAFLFPGIEPTFDPQVDDVADHFGLVPPPVAGGLEETGLAVVAVSRLLTRVLARLGIQPDLFAGHSIGEWTGLVVSERIPPDFAQSFIDSLVPGTLAVPDVVYAMAGCSAEKAQPALADLRDVALSHDNCPHQVILCGPEAQLDVAIGRLRDQQVFTQKLPFRSGFHSPLFESLSRTFAAQACRHPVGAERAAPLVRDDRGALSGECRCGPCALWPAPHRDGAVSRADRAVARRGRAGLRAGRCRQWPGWLRRGHAAWQALCRGEHQSEKAQRSQSAEARARHALLRRTGARSAAARCCADPGAAAAAGCAVGAAANAVGWRGSAATSGGAGDRNAAQPTVQRVARPRSGGATRGARGVDWSQVRGESPVPPATWSDRQRLSTESHPYLLDHCFYRQPAVWAEVSDRFPVVPATLSLDWLFEAAEAIAHEAVQVLENVLALRWLAVAPPIEIVRQAERVSADRVAVSINGYAVGEAPLRAQPSAWSLPPPLSKPQPLPISVSALYPDRWMFHGPAYQGITELTAWAPEGLGGIDGEITVPSAPGALLDNAGQLFGLWVMLRAERDRLALPTRLERVERFGPPPRVGDRLRCAVRLTAFTEREARADLWLWHVDGRPYCRITGWEDRRFDSDDQLWEVLRWPERELLAVRRPHGYLLVTDAWRQLPSRELLARRYLGARERQQWEALPSRRQGQWLNGRIAVKDAVRDLLWRRGHGQLFPVEIEVDNDPQGRPFVCGPAVQGIQVSLAHVEGAAAAIASDQGPVGIDLERPQARPPGFIESVLSPEEQARLPNGALQDPLWLARVWTAKEAAAKAAGTGLSGDPLTLVLQACDEQKMLISDRWTHFAWDDPFVVSWSTPS